MEMSAFVAWVARVGRRAAAEKLGTSEADIRRWEKRGVPKRSQELAATKVRLSERSVQASKTRRANKTFQEEVAPERFPDGLLGQRKGERPLTEEQRRPKVAPEAQAEIKRVLGRAQRARRWQSFEGRNWRGKRSPALLFRDPDTGAPGIAFAKAVEMGLLDFRPGRQGQLGEWAVRAWRNPEAEGMPRARVLIEFATNTPNNPRYKSPEFLASRRGQGKRGIPASQIGMWRGDRVSSEFLATEDSVARGPVIALARRSAAGWSVKDTASTRHVVILSAQLEVAQPKARETMASVGQPGRRKKRKKKSSKKRR